MTIRNVAGAPVTDKTIFYHATRADLEDVILKEGLQPNKPSNWSDLGVTGYVYMGENPKSVIDWMKLMWTKALQKGRKNLGDVVVFKVVMDGLQPIDYDVGRSWKYMGPVPPTRLSVFCRLTARSDGGRGIKWAISETGAFLQLDQLLCWSIENQTGVPQGTNWTKRLHKLRARRGELCDCGDCKFKLRQNPALLPPAKFPKF